MQAVETAIAEHDFEALCHPWTLPHGRDCVPTIEHYLPLLVTLGTAIDEPVHPLYKEWEHGSLELCCRPIILPALQRFLWIRDIPAESG